MPFTLGNIVEPILESVSSRLKLSFSATDIICGGLRSLNDDGPHLGKMDWQLLVEQFCYGWLELAKVFVESNNTLIGLGFSEDLICVTIPKSRIWSSFSKTNSATISKPYRWQPSISKCRGISPVR